MAIEDGLSPKIVDAGGRIVEFIPTIVAAGTRFYEQAQAPFNEDEPDINAWRQMTGEIPTPDGMNRANVVADTINTVDAGIHEDRNSLRAFGGDVINTGQAMVEGVNLMAEVTGIAVSVAEAVRPVSEFLHELNLPLIGNLISRIHNVVSKVADLRKYEKPVTQVAERIRIIERDSLLRHAGKIIKHTSKIGPAINGAVKVQGAYDNVKGVGDGVGAKFTSFWGKVKETSLGRMFFVEDEEEDDTAPAIA